MSNFYVYIFFHPVSGLPCYVGKGIRHRWKHHDKHATNKWLRSLIAKYGVLPRLKIAENLTDENACAVEKFFIKAIGRACHGGPLVNMTDGGDGMAGYKHSEDTKQKYRESFLDPDMRAKKLAGLENNRGRKHSEETLEKLRGRVCSEETKEKLRKAAEKRWSNPENKEKHKAACAGRGSVSEETKQKISIAGKGRKKSLETCAKLSAALKGKKRAYRPRGPQSEETKRKISEANKRGMTSERRSAIAEINRNRVETPESRARRRDGQLRRHGKIP